MKYSEKLKDPRWQKKRLDIMSRSNFSCEKCGETEKTLHVHHKIYLNEHEPWDYHDSLLSCLCADCHEDEHSNTSDLALACASLHYDGPGNRDQAIALIYGLLDVGIENMRNLLGKHHSYDAMYIAAQRFSQDGSYWSEWRNEHGKD